MQIDDQTLGDVLVALITVALAGYALTFLLRVLRRGRPDLSIALPVAIGFALRIVAAGALSLTSVAQALRGGDEIGFVANANAISQSSLGSEQWLDSLTGALHEFVFAIQMRILDSPEMSLRVTQAAIAIAGLALLATGVYELAGPRAARIAAWVLAFEPTSIFFSTLLHKEPNMVLAGGLVVFGGCVLWKRGEVRALLPIAAGCLLAVATRPYAGWFLIAAGAAITLHAGIRHRRERSVRALVLLALVVLLATLTAPLVLKASTNESLAGIQASQNANVFDDDANLQLEQVDYSTRGAVITGLPQRIRDVLLRPYPWQLDNTSQQFGLIGTTVAWVCLLFLIGELIRRRGRIMELAAPFIYIGFFLLIAYSLSAGNAGTAFRYRSHLVVLAICTIVVLRLAAPEFRRARAPIPMPPEASPSPT